MKRTFAMIMTLFIMLTTILVGCGGNTGNKGVTNDGKAKVRFASWDVAEDIDRQQELVDRFNAAHEDIEVTLEAYGSDFDTKIGAGMGSGDPPDVMYMWNYPSYFGGLEPLDEYVAKEGESYKANFYDTLWNYNSIDDKIYGVPVGFTTHTLFYNKDIYAEAGIAEPTNDWTWDDLEAAAKTISENTSAKGFSFHMKPDPYDFEMYLWSNGTAYCDAEGNLDNHLNSAPSQEVFKMFQDMEKEGYATATEKSGTNEFRSGATAMYIYGSWAIDSLNEDGLNYGVVTMPSFAKAGKDSVSILSSSGISMANTSKNKEAAWEFMKFWTNEEANKERIGLELPVLNSVVESEKIMGNPIYAPFYMMLEQSTDYTPASFIIESWSELSERLSLSFEEMFNPSALKDVSEVLNNAAQ